MPEPTPPAPSGPPSPTTWRDRIELLGGTAVPSPARLVAGAVALVVALVVAWLVVRQPTPTPPELALPLAEEAGPAASSSTTAPVELVVHAAGAVTSPGVYRLPAGARVADVLDAAGGPLPDAEVDRLNLAAPVVDGAQVYVPRPGEVASVPSGTSDPAAGPLDVNTATPEQLDGLPGIGPATAEAIVEERERRGGFGSVEDLLDVRGIGPAKLDDLRDLVTV